MVRNYRELEVWQRAMDLAVECYRLTDAFPKSEVYGMVSQVRRAASSVAANIAEGRGRRSTGDFKRFLEIAYGSLMELETHLLLATRIDYLDARITDDLLTRSGEVGKMLNGLLASLRNQRPNRPLTADR